MQPIWAHLRKWLQAQMAMHLRVKKQMRMQPLMQPQPHTKPRHRRLTPALLPLLFCLALVTGCGASAPLSEPPVHSYGVKDAQFVRTMDNLLGPPLLHGNLVTTLVNGGKIFPAMLGAINAAQKSITFETFVYESGTVGTQVTEALANRARAGVKVHVIIDAVGGAPMDPSFVPTLREAGAQVLIYRPVNLFTLDKVNHRTHRKILVVDGRIGFTGGVGIGDAWDGDCDGPSCWRDNHYMIQGPVVGSLQAAFNDNWMEARGELLDGPDYFPALEPAGPHYGQVVISSPETGSACMLLMYLLSINAAEHSLYLATPYFVPDEMTLTTLEAARHRGVVVRIIVPSVLNDSWVARSASRAVWGKLLRAGVEIYEYQPTLYHTKLMVVDGLWTSVGSTNVSNRSFRLNDEMNLNVYDADFAAKQVALLEKDIARSRRITLEEWNNRSMGDRFKNFLGWLVSPQL